MTTNTDRASPTALQQAIDAHQQGRLALAATLYRTLLEQVPDNADALHLLGVVEGQEGDLTSARSLINRSLQVDADQPLARANLAGILLRLQQPEAAVEQLEQALRLKPEWPEVLCQHAAALQGLGRPLEALTSLERALRLQPARAESYVQHARLLLQLQRTEAALASFQRALVLQPRLGSALRGRTQVLAALGLLAEALSSCEQALHLVPGDADLHNERGILLQRLQQPAEAAASFDRALTLAGPQAAFLSNRAAALSSLGRVGEAAHSLEQALALEPDYPYALGNFGYTRLQCCDWRNYAEISAAIRAGVAAGRRVVNPFAFLLYADSCQSQLASARICVEDLYPPRAPLPHGPRTSRDRIPVGYLSADFGDHPTSHLLVGVLEEHDRSRFEVVGLSMGPSHAHPVRTRVSQACDRFIDVSQRSDAAIADLIRELRVELLVDINGFALGGRLGIAALRPAPLQIGYLGFPGGTGAAYIDYLIADAHVIPPQARDAYAEKIIYLPDCYQPNDARRSIAQRSATRGEAGLPEEAFVFCCFNASHKITPWMFDIWMRLLRQVPGSVLWLYEGRDQAAQNLRREAAARGVARERLIFATRQPLAEHLARHALADLFLDTLPYNAHTTASDALWAGLPLITCTGDTFASRVAGSLLKSLDLGELVVDTLSTYEALALELASDPARLSEIRAKLLRNRHTRALFDTRRYCHHLEHAYQTVWELHQRGEPPRDVWMDGRS